MHDRTIRRWSKSCTGRLANCTWSWTGSKKKLPSSTAERRQWVTPDDDRLNITQQCALLDLPRSTYFQADHHHSCQQRTADHDRPSRPTKHDRAIRQNDKDTTPRQFQRPRNAKDIAEDEEVTNDKRDNKAEPPSRGPQTHRRHDPNDNHHAIDHRHPKPRLESCL